MIRPHKDKSSNYRHEKTPKLMNIDYHIRNNSHRRAYASTEKIDKKILK